MLTDTKNVDSATGKMYLIDQRVQDFLKITDPEIKSKLVMMSLSKNSSSPFGKIGMLDHTQPKGKVFTKLNIVDGYSGDQEEHKASELKS